MRRHTQDVGVRKWAGGDMVELQSETLKALDGFLGEYGPCVIKGCEITSHESTFDVAPGLVVLSGVDPKGGSVTMIVPFKGATGVALPLYLALAYTVRERAYADGKVKPIAYDYHAQASGVAPVDGVAHLKLTAEQTPRFVDVLQDDGHSFITDIERTVWNGKANLSYVNSELAKKETPAAAQTKAEAALRSAKEYSDTTASALRSAMTSADMATLNSAKSYAGQIVAALVDSSPEALNTLQELAAALGGDPNFSTTVMQMIGERVTTEAFTTALAGKFGGFTGLLDSPDDAPMNAIFHTHHSAANLPVDGQYMVGFTMAIGNNPIFANQIAYCDGYWWIRSRYVPGWGPWRMLYHSGNLGLATSASDGLMAKDDKVRLDGAPNVVAAGSVALNGALTTHKGAPALSHALGSDTYVIRHNADVGDKLYSVQLTPLNGDRIVYIESKGYNTFTVKGTSLASSGRESGFEFVVIKY